MSRECHNRKPLQNTFHLLVDILHLFVYNFTLLVYSLFLRIAFHLLVDILHLFVYNLLCWYIRCFCTLRAVSR